MKLSEKGDQIEKTLQTLYKDCLEYCHEAEKHNWISQDRMYKMGEILDKFEEKFKHLNNHVRQKESQLPDNVRNNERSIIERSI